MTCKPGGLARVEGLQRVCVWRKSMPPSASKAAGTNHNSIGDLVPMHRKMSGSSKPLEKVLSAAIDATPDGSSEGWRVMPAPLVRELQQFLMEPAYTCVVQLPGDPAVVGVLKVAEGGHCTLFLRMGRDLLTKWATKHNEDSVATARRVFFKPNLPTELACAILSKARPFCLVPGQVHHPYALSILCSMSLGKWLVPPLETNDLRIPDACGSLCLVALPPLDANLEQCLCLLGHKATFGNEAGGADSDDEDDVPLSAKVNQNVWGETHGSCWQQEYADKFKAAAEIFGNYSHPNALKEIVPDLNACAGQGAYALEKMTKAFAAALKASKEKAPSPSAAPPKTKEPKAQAKSAPKQAPSSASTSTADAALPPPAAAESPDLQDIELLPSDPSEDEAGSDDEQEPEPEPQPQPQPATTSAPRQAKRARKNESDESEGEEDEEDEEEGEGEGEESSSESEESEEEEGEDEAACVDTGDESGSDADDEEEEGEEEEEGGEDEEDEEEEEEEEATPKKKKQKVVVQEDAKEYAKAVAEEACNKMMLDSMGTLLHESFNDIETLKPLVAPELYEKLTKIRWESCCKAVTPTKLVLGVNELVRALVRAHAERFTGETVTISKAEYERTHKLASTAVDFSASTMERVCKALDQLEEARELGRAALAPLQDTP